ncbi:hypothetical protein BOTNAR_0099g00060 [Botryotinia narcissicola]|uniref:Zn(2)-C6 fungal-type domain-containing protein n=1 Tax=Botryotinia narcissicola TaxID=278944 RepID=A0A4Z1IPK6_9HELO|nr:hypothetical protein BOTNAR_0099g00060 [Botryotinia narcissicola]
MESNQSPHEKFMCSVCEKSQLRHISYCKRVRSRGGVRSRKRACSACTKSKTQCDWIHPSCSRCLKKSLGCVYEGPHLSRGKTLEPEVKNHADTGAEQTKEASLNLSSSQDVTAPLLLDIHGASMVSNPLQILGITADDTMNLELPNENWNLDTEDCFPEHMDISVFSTPTKYSPRLLPIELSPIFASYQPNNSGTFYRLYNQPIPIAPKAFALRKPSNNQFSLNRSYILCTLPTYPSMLLPSNDDGLPPFIHPHFNSRKALLAPLATCFTIIQWINSVAALQAITIYLLLRISEDNEKATNFDVPLISAMIKTSKMRVCYRGKNGHWLNPHAVHEYRCDENRLKHMTIPCSRKLWRATTNEAWENEYANSMRGIQLTYGDLINSRNRPEDRRLDGWLSQLDDFGMLVLAAASLAS